MERTLSFMDATLSAVINWGILALTFLGVAMSRNPPLKGDARAQRTWIALFVVFGLAVGIAQTWLVSRNQNAQNELRAELTGADNYCFFQADLNRPQPTGTYEWQLNNKDKRPIPNLQICLYLQEEFTRCWQQGMCIPHSVDQAKDEGGLPLGKHRFEFFGANSWSQILEIYMDGETPRQRGKIMRKGIVIGKVPQ